MNQYNRRDFLKTAAGAAALAITDRAAAETTGMFVSLNGSLVKKMEWQDFARLAARIGYRGVDLNLAAAMKDGVDATRALLADLKIQPGVTTLPASPFARDDATFKSGMDRLDEACQFAAAVGCPRAMVVLPPASDAPKDELRKLYKDRLITMSEVLLKHRVRLGMEFLGPLYMHTRAKYEFIWRMNEAVEFARECGPNIGVQLDAWHWHHSGATVGDILDAGKSRVVSVHVSDARKQPPEEVRDNQRLMPGEGIIDLIGFFQALQKIGYVDAISPEPLGRIPQEMPSEDGARLGLDTTLAVMKKAGLHE